MRTFEIKCPHCNWEQKRMIYKGLPKGKRSKCYKCEKSFNIHKNANESNIIRG